MAKASLAQITRYCDRLLRTAAITDYDGAFNGLQVENRGKVTRIVAAVDATTTTVKRAIAAEADLLLVHHGLFWSPRQPWTGRSFELLRLLLENDLAVYSSHLPLDVHPKFGNNARLCAALGLKPRRPFLECKGQPVGVEARTSLPRAELVRRLEVALGGPVKLAPGGPVLCRRIGIVT
ncbi:MAG TPA: Nif3-like dinuclear metal center hexameric protein, partial [Verrucomicrobiae bacterium]